MALGLAPLVQRRSNHKDARLALRVGLMYAAGLVVGAAATATALKLAVTWLSLASPPMSARLLMGIFAVLVAGIGLVDVRHRHRQAVGFRWQVPKELVGKLGLQRAFIVYGLLLGSGCWTQMPAAVFWSYIVSIAFAPSVWLAILISCVFALATAFRMGYDLWSLRDGSEAPNAFAQRRIVYQTSLRYAVGVAGAAIGGGLFVRSLLLG